jgi:hypothetical protein
MCTPGFCVILININDSTRSGLLCSQPPGQLPLSVGAGVGERGVQLPLVLSTPPPAPSTGRGPGSWLFPLSLDFLPGPLPQPGLAGCRHGEQQRGDPARAQAGKVPAAPPRKLCALAQVRLLRYGLLPALLPGTPPGASSQGQWL